MLITVDLAGQLSHSRSRHQTLEVPQRTTAGQVADLLGLQPEEIGLIMINGVQSELQDALSHDCRLCFFPYLTGG